MITIKTRKAVSRLKDTFRASLVSPPCITLLPPKGEHMEGELRLSSHFIREMQCTCSYLVCFVINPVQAQVSFRKG